MIGTHKTTQRIKDDILSVVYHNTEVVKVRNNRYITLDNGGYYTATSKRRMNQASQQYNLGFSVYQSDFCWYVRIGDDIEPYYNGITIDKETKLISRKSNNIN
tara:strand:- start:199 stop:507 length:309 start_codon:yes stop_codon:yes gene_type:complete